MSTETQHLTTAQVANRLVELCRQGKVLEAQQELFADDVACIEPNVPGAMQTTNGKAAAIEKGEQFAGMIEAVHGAQITDPIVVGNWFTIGWTMDVTMKGQGRSNMEEILVYKVKDGQIVSEQYFY
jgi:hypothetical protein